LHLILRFFESFPFENQFKNYQLIKIAGITMGFKKLFKALTSGLVLILLLLTVSAIGWADAISLSEYQGRIQESVERLERNEGTLLPEEISWIRKTFPPDLMVADMEEQPVPVDRQEIRRWTDEVENFPQARERLVAYLKATSRQISMEEQGIINDGPDWQESRALLDEVYAAKEFRHLAKRKDPAWKMFVLRVLEAVGNWLKEHLGALEGISFQWVRYLAWGTVLLLGAVILAWIIALFGPVDWGWKPSRARPAQQRETPPERDWRALRKQAYDRASQGSFREAIRYIFLSVLVEGDRKGWWIYQPETTNREHLSRLSNQVERYEPLQMLIERYERAWYGLGKPGKEEFEACEKLANRVEAAA
jgi:hypothetical protein